MAPACAWVANGNYLKHIYVSQATLQWQLFHCSASFLPFSRQFRTFHLPQSTHVHSHWQPKLSTHTHAAADTSLLVLIVGASIVQRTTAQVRLDAYMSFMHMHTYIHVYSCDFSFVANLYLNIYMYMYMCVCACKHVLVWVCEFIAIG